ncbi:MAG: hypothetical protein WCD70_10075 [Alphaproteobacteria bacterium]
MSSDNSTEPTKITHVGTVLKFAAGVYSGMGIDKLSNGHTGHAGVDFAIAAAIVGGLTVRAICVEIKLSGQKAPAPAATNG